MAKFFELLRNADLSNLWNETEPAGEHEPLPPGQYLATIERGELRAAGRRETPAYTVTFRVVEGPYTGRRVWYDVWLTPAALPYAKRDLMKIGITDPRQLERPVPQGIRCRVRVARRETDDGTIFNRVTGFDVVEIAQPDADPFAPSEGEAMEETP